jgi:hypothetical protein
MALGVRGWRRKAVERDVLEEAKAGRGLQRH